MYIYEVVYLLLILIINYIFYMSLGSFKDVFLASLEGVWGEFASFIPEFLVALIIFIVGWWVSAAIGKAVAQVLAAVKVDNLFESIGAHNVFKKAGFKFSFSKFIGELVKWFLIVVVLMTSLEIVGLSQVNFFLGNVVLGYLPQVIVASLIIVFAAVVSDFAQKMIQGAASAMGTKSARLAGTVVKYAIWLFTIIIALAELGIAEESMKDLFTAIVYMLALAGGLAFGLGGKEAAGKAINKFSDSIKHKED